MTSLQHEQAPRPGAGSQVRTCGGLTRVSPGSRAEFPPGAQSATALGDGPSKRQLRGNEVLWVRPDPVGRVFTRRGRQDTGTPRGHGGRRRPLATQGGLGSAVPSVLCVTATPAGECSRVCENYPCFPGPPLGDWTQSCLVWLLW